MSTTQADELAEMTISEFRVWARDLRRPHAFHRGSEVVAPFVLAEMLKLHQRRRWDDAIHELRNRPLMMMYMADGW